MALPISSSSTFNFKSSSFLKFQRFSHFFNQPFPSSSPISASFPIPNPSTSTSTCTSTSTLRVVLCCAANSHTEPVKKRSSSTGNSKKKKKKKKKSSAGIDDSNALNSSDFEIVQDFPIDDQNFSYTSDSSFDFHPTPLPKPPAGFLVDHHGKVLLASTKRLVTIVDPTNNLPLECVIRRVFRSSQGDECMLICPADTPVQILKSTNADGWSAVSDEEVESILPTVAYALAKIHMHLVYSGYCYTARGGFCYTEEDIFDFHTDDVKEVDGLPTEGVEITYFNLEGSHYMIYTPSDPLLFVAVKDQNGMLQIADDELLEDTAIISAIDEETEFNALVEEEAALLDSIMGEG